MSGTQTVGDTSASGSTAVGEVDAPVHRGSMFGLPGETTFLFVLLVAMVTISSSFFMVSLFASATGAQRVAQAFGECLPRAESGAPPVGPADIHAVTDSFKGQLSEVRAWEKCLSPLNHQLLLWQAGGLGLVFAMGALLYLMHPTWYVRRRRLRRLDPDEAADLLAELGRLQRLAGVGKVRFLLEPHNTVPSAFVFGLPRRRALALSTGMVVRHHTDPAAFRAVVLHEMAHLRNRDIEPTYLALTLTAAFGLVLGTDSGMWLFAYPGFGLLIGGPLLQALLLGILALLLLAALVRSREFQADARVAEWEANGAALARVLRDMPAPRSRAMGALRALHPTPAQRVQGLSGTMPPFGLGYWGGVAVGLTASVTLLGLRGLFSLWSLVDLPMWVSALPGILVAAVVVVGRWRYESAHPRGAPRRTWPLGLGLATGTGVSPLLAPQSFIAQRALHDLLLWFPGWVLLVVATTVPVTSWTTEAVAAWYRATGRPTVRKSRRHPPVALLTAVVMAAVCYVYLSYVVVVGNSLVELTDNPLLDLYRTQARVNEPAVLIPLVLVTGLPLLLIGLGALAVLILAVNALCRRWRTRPDRHDRPRPRRALPSEARRAVRTGLVGGAVPVLFVPLMSLSAHQLPLAERWHTDFLTRFSYLQLAAVAVVATATAVAAAWRSRNWPLSAGALAAAVCVVVGAAAVLGQGPLGNCLDVLEGPVSDRACPKPPRGAHVWMVVQILVGWTGLTTALLLPPCAFLRERTRRAQAARSARAPLSRSPRIPGLRGRPWLRRGVLALALTMVSSPGAFVLAQESRVDDTRLTAASVGDGGWVRGNGYRMRMVPGWYDTTGDDAGLQGDDGHALELRLQRPGFAQRASLVVLRTTRWPIDRYTPLVLEQGGRLTEVAGARALLLDAPTTDSADRMRIIVIEHGDEQLRLQLTDHPTNWQITLDDLKTMLKTWQWTSPAHEQPEGPGTPRP